MQFLEVFPEYILVSFCGFKKKKCALGDFILLSQEHKCIEGKILIKKLLS